MEKCIPEIVNNINEAKSHSCKTGESSAKSPALYINHTTEELVEVIKSCNDGDVENGLLSISEDYSKSIEALKGLFMKLTNSHLPVDNNDNIYLCLDFDKEEHKEFVTALEGVKLPALDTLMIENF
mmetsp:Transcript_23332/g.20716  ORF Transcript_23332/g.20716 Transcript_23332/m.20716 type:complete len:126 (+) Transcript_23332:311-688(+)